MMLLKRTPSHSWWFDSHYSPRRSPWLQATLSELDEKTKAMLKLIEEDADSFAQRAEMYYKKRPELVNMVEDFYRAHRSLAERYDQLKLEYGTRNVPALAVSLFSTEAASQNLGKPSNKSMETSSECFDSDESEVDDPENEGSQLGEYVEGSSREEEEREEISSKDATNIELLKLREEVEKLKEQNRIQKEELRQRNDEKREAIRQLSFTMETLREENIRLKRSLRHSNSKKSRHHLLEFSEWIPGLFPFKFFGGPKSQNTIVAAL